MKQKKLIVTVTDSHGAVIYQRDPAHPQDLISVLQLFDDIGNIVTINIEEIEIPSSMKS